MNLKTFFIFFCFSTLIFGQIKFEGEVSDSLKIPLQSASVVAIDNETNGLESYGLTDEKGKFKINLKENKAYKIQVSSIGLITINEILETNEEDIVKNYTLRAIPAPLALWGPNVEHRAPQKNKIHWKSCFENGE